MTPSRTSAQNSSLRPLLVVTGVIAVMYLAREVLIPFAFALTLAFILSPLVASLQRMRLPRFLAVLLVMTIATLATAGIAWEVANQLVVVVNDLPKYRQNIRNKIDAFRSPKQSVLAKATESVKEISKDLTAASPPPSPTTPAPRSRVAPAPPLPTKVELVEPEITGVAYLRALVEPFLAPLAQIGVILIFTVFMLANREDLRNRFIRLAGGGRLNVMTQAIDDAVQRVSKYLQLQFLINGVFGAIFGAGLFFIGVPYAFLWGALAGIFRIIPYIGALAAAGLPFVLSLAVFDGWQQPVMVFTLYFVLELIIGNFVEPLLYGAHTGISSLAILVTAVFWTVLWGLPGLVLSTPLTVCAVVLGRYVPQLGFLHILLGEDPVLEPQEHVYQRLLAMDPQEAKSVTDEYLKTHPLVELYDAVLLPALALAEQDRHKGDLDPAREESLFLSLSEMIADYAEHQDVAPETAEPEEAVVESDRVAEPPVAVVRAAAGPRILCFPARDEADAISAAMLAQVLERAGFSTICLPIGVPLDDVKPLLRADSEDVICICAVPPFALAHSRTMFKQVAVRYPEIPVVVGIWGFTSDLNRAKAHFAQDANMLITTISDALKRFGELRDAGHAPDSALPKPSFG